MTPLVRARETFVKPVILSEAKNLSSSVLAARDGLPGFFASLRMTAEKQATHVGKELLCRARQQLNQTFVMFCSKHMRPMT
jgi:hypothetical protein